MCTLQVQWTLNGEPFSDRYVLQSDSVLRFTNISVAHQGSYRCNAENTAGTTFAEATIQVTGSITLNLHFSILIITHALKSLCLYSISYILSVAEKDSFSC